MTDADRRRAAFAMVAADAFAKGAAQREREIVAGLRVSVGSFQPRFFSDGATEQPRRIGQCFSADDVERFTDYFSEDEDGYYSGHVHRYFGMDLKTFADRSHLRRVQITRKDGHRTWVWVNPNKKKPDERKPGAEKPKAERTSHPENVAKPTSDYHPTADSETAVAKALANPDSLTIDHVIDLSDHLEKLQKSKVKAILKGVGEKVGGLKHELVDRLLEHLRGEAGLPTKKEKDAGVSDEFLNREQVDKTERELTKPVVPPIPRRKIPLGEPEVSDALGNKPVPAEKVAPTKPAIPHFRNESFRRANPLHRTISVSSRQSRNNPMNEEQEADETLKGLQKQADEWRTRLSNPELQAQIKAGMLRISPLVRDLLRAFPPLAPKSIGE